MNTSDQKDANEKSTNNTPQDSAQKSEANNQLQSAQNSTNTSSEQNSTSQEKIPNFTWGGVIFLLVLIGISYMMFKYIKI
jgi:hypothetical protein